MAWDCFGEANGAPERGSFLRLLAERRAEPLDPTGDFEIGCLLIGRPVFFPESEWVRPPADWPRTGVQQGKSYDVTEGEGLRLYDECLRRAAAYPAAILPGAGASPHAGGRVERFGSAYLTKPRLGQGGFRVAVIDTYDRTCAISTEHSLPVLEAAHIRPYHEGGEHDVRNGLLLRADIHKLFDKGFVTVTPEYRFLVSDRLRADYANGRVYYELQARIREAGRIHLPADPALRPDPDLLAWHNKEKFVA